LPALEDFCQLMHGLLQKIRFEVVFCSMLYIQCRSDDYSGKVAMGLKISPGVKEKLKKKHCVADDEITQCFAGRAGRYLMDRREDHQTDPPTLWFIAETDYGRLLKVVFIQSGDDIIIKTAYAPNDVEIDIYNRYG